MKKIFAVYLSVLCAFPILVSGNVPCSTYNNNRANCLAKGGCWFDSFVSPTVCDACYNDQYNPQQQNCNDEDNDNCENSCQSVPFGSYKNDAGTGYLACPTNNIISAGDTDVMYIGNCSCTANTQLIKTTQDSVDKYYCGECGLGEPNTNGSITTCTCYDAPGVNRVYGDGPARSSTRTECECPNGATWQDNACKCGLNKYLDQTDDGYICQSCPGHALTSAIGATSFDECLCEAGYYMSGNTCKSCPEHASCSYAGRTYENVQCASGYQKIPDPSTQTFVCRSCSDAHAHLDNNGTGNCLCDPGYYGEIQGLQTSCTQCPIGMTTNSTVTAQDISACSMTHNTKFCITGQSNSCVNFIPFGATIYPQN